MRNKILLYLFIFSALFCIFIYVNDKKILDSLEEDLAQKEQLIEELEKENTKLLENNKNEDVVAYFSLENNEEGLSYFESKGIKPEEVLKAIDNALIDANSAKGNNMVPYDGIDGPMRINRIKVLNHKWIIADFTDGTYWGEMLLTYEVYQDGPMELTVEKSFLYPVN